ncbi:MAG: FHA domain-containing protein [Thermoguttaceae bacterium]|jgi:hypothetical protein
MPKWLETTMYRDMIFMDRSFQPATDRFFLWVDAVGGYWVCLGPEVTLGQPGAGRQADIPILGDLSQQQARIRRDGEGYLIEALREVRVDGRRVERLASLADGSVIQLGPSVRLRFRRPHPLSATVRLDFLSRHRTEPSVDGVLLMADTCVLGPKAHSHVVCRDWAEEVVLYRHGDQLYCCTAAAVEIDGVRCHDRTKLTRHSRIVGDTFSLSLEAMDK